MRRSVLGRPFWAREEDVVEKEDLLTGGCNGILKALASAWRGGLSIMAMLRCK